MMENEERHASYAAAASSKSTLAVLEPVLDSWEEAAQDGVRSQELERSIEEKLGQMKQKQNIKQNVGPNHSSGSPLDDSPLAASQGESRSSADLTAPGPSSALTIRILKRPQSSGHLPQQGYQPRANVSEQGKQLNQNPSTSADARSSNNGNYGRGSQQQQQQQRTLEERAAAYAEARMRIFGVADQQIHDDLPVQPKLSIPANRNSPGSSSNT